MMRDSESRGQCETGRAAPGESGGAGGHASDRLLLAAFLLRRSAPSPHQRRQQACPLPSSPRHPQQALPQQPAAAPAAGVAPQLRQQPRPARFHFLGTRMMDRHDRLVAAVREVDQLARRRQRNVRQALDVVDLHRRQVDLQELRQILRQALTSTSLSRCDTTPPCVFTPGAAGRALEVQRNRHADLLVLQHALQIHVQDLVLRRMALHVLEDRGLRLAVDLQRRGSSRRIARSPAASAGSGDRG